MYIHYIFSPLSKIQQFNYSYFISNQLDSNYKIRSNFGPL